MRRREVITLLGGAAATCVMNGRIIVILFLSAMLSSLVLNAPALSQAGSTGGTIGNTDKSASGGQNNPSGHNPRTKPKQPVSVQPPSDSAVCRSVIGAWKWVGVITTDVVFKSDHTISDTAGGHGEWTCSDGLLEVSWTNGYVDHLAIAGNRTTLSGNSGWVGVSITATRK